MGRDDLDYVPRLSDDEETFCCHDCGSREDRDAYMRNTPEGEPLCKRCGDHEVSCEACGEATHRQFITYQDICTTCADDLRASTAAVQDEPRWGSQ